ncbi:SAM-dependent methyltransferase TehB [Affinibrenneria salicis]|uniref:SAM-dependent methyltransferase TehB n=1 Tax=Affinibrenneria salicis TaxID=2590031 RepID=A0A5J5FXM4_9GAMM|nr:SAM-dependent methyltransferase TehB [Affinibrenneria salicis]KAA8997709.1 SAM-dependent methyltransferase TehB [Affinibrenneria salicis]
MQQELICYKTLPRWNSRTLPAELRAQHNTQDGSWVQLTIFRGELTFAFLQETGEVISQQPFSPQRQPPRVEPQAWHRIVSSSEDMECQLAFFCRAEDYYHKKYGLTRTHSEVIAALRHVSPCRALDLGCGSGRNALYLNKMGFDVAACDKNASGIDSLNAMIKSEGLRRITAGVYDINEAAIDTQYGFILSTVVMMFLAPTRIPAIIDNMQQSTLAGGYNLIVAAMSTDDVPCPLPFSFTFKQQELRDYYRAWEIIKYNEDMGELHKTDAAGNRIKLRFATLLARKTSA